MKKPELFKKYSRDYLIKKFKFYKKDVLKQQLLESLKEIINSCN
jgi:hypothetical protein